MKSSPNRMYRLPEPTYSEAEKAVVMEAFKKVDHPHVSAWIREVVLREAAIINKTKKR